MENYKKPPITEAIFEIQASLPRHVTAKDIDSFSSNFSARFPVKKAVQQFQSEFGVKDGKPIDPKTTNLGIFGYQCWSEDQSQVLNFRLNGFSFNQLKPYEGWDKSFSIFVEYWEKYEKEFSPTIKGASCRFINLINIPEFNLPKYFTLEFNVLKSFKKQVDKPIGEAETQSFFSKSIFRIPNPACKVVLTFTTSNKTDPSFTPIILDTDISTDMDTAVSKDKILGIFRQLREIKNDVFEAVITPETRGLFQ